MTVHELIKLLQKFPGSQPVVVPGEDGFYNDVIKVTKKMLDQHPDLPVGSYGPDGYLHPDDNPQKVTVVTIN